MTLALRWTLGGAITFLLAAITACAGPDADSAVQQADSAGMEIVTYAGPDRPLPWTFEVEFTLGGKGTDAESFYRLDRSTVGVDAAGNLYVLDASANRVVVFDDTGRHVRSMGGEGGGPGEMRFPVTISVAPDGSVDVFDVSKRGFVRFGPEGEILEEERVTVSLGSGAARRIDHALVVPIRDVDTDRGIDRDELVIVDGTDTTTFVSVERAVGGVVNLTSCGMQIMGIGPIFRPGIRWTPLGSTVAVATVATYAITIYRDGLPIRALRRAVAPVPATPELAAARVGTGMKVMTTGGVRTCDAQVRSMCSTRMEPTSAPCPTKPRFRSSSSATASPPSRQMRSTWNGW
jgi:hypothetical protein